MNSLFKSSATTNHSSLLMRGALALLILLGWLSINAHGQTQADNTVTSRPMHVTHILGFEDVRRNVGGKLSIENDCLSFERDGGQSAQVTISSIQNISLGEQDKQIGGVPLTLGKAAVPFGGGRAVSLFSHKKYDSVAIEYLDSTGGFHGAVFRLAKGQGEGLKTALMAHGARIASPAEPAYPETAPDNSADVHDWSLQVDRVDPGATTLDPSFSYAIYENLVRDLNKSRQFKDVFRSGDRNANHVSQVLVLKTVVDKYSRGSETQRAVTTVTGATKLKVHIQLVTRNGHVLLERTLEGNVRFIGDNLGATSKVANNTAKALKRAELPTPADLTAQEARAQGVKGTL